MTATGRFGPNTAQIERLLELIKGATPGQVNQLAAARYAARGAARDAAWYAARDAAWYAAWSDAWDADRYAAWSAAWDAAASATRSAARSAAWYADWSAALDAAWSAAAALVVADLVGQHGYTQDHHDLLMGPVRAVFGHEDTWGDQ